MYRVRPRKMACKNSPICRATRRVERLPGVAAVFRRTRAGRFSPPFGFPLSRFSIPPIRASTLYSRQLPLLRSRSITATVLTPRLALLIYVEAEHTLLENRGVRSPAPLGVERKRDADREATRRGKRDRMPLVSRGHSLRPVNGYPLCPGFFLSLLFFFIFLFFSPPLLS